MDNTGHKISSTTAGLMITTSAFFDLLLGLINLIPFVGNIASAVFAVPVMFMFFIWFKMRGVTFTSPKKSLSFWGASLIELIPIINILPATTFAVVRVILLTRAEEKLASVAPTIAAAARRTGTQSGSGSGPRV